MKSLFLLYCLLCLLPGNAQNTLQQQLNSRRVTLPNGWRLSAAGRSMPLGDLPLNIAVSPNSKYMVVTNNGQSVQSIQLINPRSEKILDQVELKKSWYGLTFGNKGKTLFVSGGNDNRIWMYGIVSDKLWLKDSIVLGKPWPEKISPAGICVDDAHRRLYVVTKENKMLYAVDLKTKSIVRQQPLEAEGYAVQLSPDAKKLYVSVWGAAKVVEYEAATLQQRHSMKVGVNPNELLLDKKGKTLYVANAADNSVSVIDVQQWKVLEVLNAALYPDAPEGSGTNGLALSTNGKQLYVANADNNCLAVFDVSEAAHSRSLGFMPVGWYPTNIKVTNRKIFVSNGKGFQSFANPNGPNPIDRKQQVTYQQGDVKKKTPVQYIGGLMKGTMSIVDESELKNIAVYSKAVYENTPYNKEKETKAEGLPGNPIPMRPGGFSPIKYVFYIVKENRTYDQVLADMPGGNGDTSLLLFGSHYTPNQHKLAEEFILLDNFYVDGEVSADGHNWSLGAHANDYLEKTWPTSYGGRGGNYDAEGQRAIANNRNGFIWDYCKRVGVSYRTYGEFADDYKANIPVLQNHFCPYYTSWDESVRDTTRFNQWRREFDSLLTADAVPRFNSLRFINDHTEGQRIGRPTPFAHVADNDWAVGLFVEYLSKSRIWNQSVVFIVEDDAQNGPDHVDAHRTTAYLAGGYVKRRFIDHTMYSTSSMLRTIELILGLPPMSQYDAAATPMYRCFANRPDATGFTSVPANVNLNDVNTKLTASAVLSNGFDFSKEDRIPDMTFSEVIWKAVKGEESVMPAPRRSAFVQVREEEEEEERTRGKR
jgi:YVTN family beta-propeller protein